MVFGGPRGRGCLFGTFLKINMLGLFFFVRNGVLVLGTFSKSAMDKGKIDGTFESDRSM